MGYDTAGHAGQKHPSGWLRAQIRERKRSSAAEEYFPKLVLAPTPSPPKVDTYIRRISVTLRMASARRRSQRRVEPGATVDDRYRAKTEFKGKALRSETA